MAFKIQVTAQAKTGGTHERVQHAHHFRTFDIDSQSVEIVYFRIRQRPHGVSHGPTVFPKLVGSNKRGVFYALDRSRPDVCTKLLVSKNSESFLQAELKPITTGDAIA